MSDLISRQAAIDAAIEAADDWDGGCNIGRQKRIEKYIRRLPSAEPHWIPVEQDLPKIGEYVLCQTTPHYFKTTNCFNNYHVCQFVDKDRWVDKPHFDWDRDGFPHVVAWTRFEPYKGVTT